MQNKHMKGNPMKVHKTLLLIALLAVPNARANIITVTSTSDSGPGTLRDALASAANGDTINFSVTGTITLTSGELTIVRSLTIIGPGASLLMSRNSISPGAGVLVSGNGHSRVFHIAPTNTTVNISGLT